MYVNGNETVSDIALIAFLIFEKDNSVKTLRLHEFCVNNSLFASTLYLYIPTCTANTVHVAINIKLLT